jgi:hypothetical protein
VIYFTCIVASPTPRPEVGDDTRTLHVDLKRTLLPTMGSIKKALNDYKTQGNSPETRSGLRRVMFDTITENVDLAGLLSTPELQLVRDRLMKLTSHPTDIECENKVVPTYLTSRTYCSTSCTHIPVCITMPLP